MKNFRQIAVDAEDINKRADVYLVVQLAISRSQVQELIRTQQILVNNASIKSNYRVRLGDKVSVCLPPPKKLETKPENLQLDIIYQDEDIVVINKQAGIVVHPAHGNYSGTLVNALLYHIRDLSSIGGVVRPGIVHRLDKDTSGILVVAKNDTAHESLSLQFKNRTVKKEYLAICYGTIRENEGVIETEIGRSISDRKLMSVKTQKGRGARTEWKILSRNNNFLLVRIIPSTGRTHQIRVHLQYKNMPIIGDETYAKNLCTRLKKEHPLLMHMISRMLLHAHSIIFRHPRNNEYVTYTAPIPEDFSLIMKHLKLSI